MAAKAEVTATNMQELVRSLGIELPQKLPNYNRKSKRNIYSAFRAEIDRLIGTDKAGSQERSLSEGGVKLTVGSRLKLVELRGEEYDYGISDPDYTSGPSRWLELRAPMKVSGVGVDAELSTGVRLVTSETYRGLLDEAPAEVDEGDIEMKVGTLWTPLPTTPAEEAFELTPSTAFAPDLKVPPARGGGTSEWRLHTDSKESHARYIAGANHNRAFGIGIEVLKQIQPGMLT